MIEVKEQFKKSYFYCCLYLEDLKQKWDIRGQDGAQQQGVGLLHRPNHAALLQLLLVKLMEPCLSQGASYSQGQR